LTNALFQFFKRSFSGIAGIAGNFGATGSNNEETIPMEVDSPEAEPDVIPDNKDNGNTEAPYSGKPFVWILKGFSKLKEKKIMSESFSSGGRKWYKHEA
jgi:hypothetical protein